MTKLTTTKLVSAVSITFLKILSVKSEMFTLMVTLLSQLQVSLFVLQTWTKKENNSRSAIFEQTNARC